MNCWVKGNYGEVLGPAFNYKCDTFEKEALVLLALLYTSFVLAASMVLLALRKQDKRRTEYGQRSEMVGRR